MVIVHLCLLDPAITDDNLPEVTSSIDETNTDTDDNETEGMNE